MHLIHLPLLSKAAGFVANISSNVAFLPQIIKSYRRKQVADISIGMFYIISNATLLDSLCCAHWCEKPLDIQCDRNSAFTAFIRHVVYVSASRYK